MPLYHATFTRNIKRIRQFGLLPGLPPIWAKGDKTPYYVGAYVYAFENFDDAVAWAGKMGWAFFQDSASSQVCVLTIDDPFSWQEDMNDPLGHAGCTGKWYRRKDAVAPQHVCGITVLTRELLKETIRRRTEQD